MFKCSLVVVLLRKTVYIFVTGVFSVEDYLVTSIIFVNVFHGKSPQFYSIYVVRSTRLFARNNFYEQNNLAVKLFSLQHKRLTNASVSYTSLHCMTCTTVQCLAELEVKLNSSSVRCHLISHQFMVMPRATERVRCLFIQLHFIQFTEDVTQDLIFVGMLLSLLRI